MTAINWAALDWPSIATAYAGTIAVVGATFVGIRQAEITKRQAGIAEAQNEILARQAEIEAQKLKADLFDRRFTTFEAVVDFLLNVRAYGEDEHAPGRVRFFTKLRESQFLFSPLVYNDLREILNHANDLWYAAAMSRSEKEHEMKPDLAHQQRVFDEINWTLARLDTIPEVFRKDLQLDDLLPR